MHADHLSAAPYVELQLGGQTALYRSISQVPSLPPASWLYLCRDYLPGGRELQYQSTAAEQRAQNVHLRDGLSEDEFVAMRQARDATLAMPTPILPSVQVNMRAGELPPAPLPQDRAQRTLSPAWGWQAGIARSVYKAR